MDIIFGILTISWTTVTRCVCYRAVCHLIQLSEWTLGKRQQIVSDVKASRFDYIIADCDVSRIRQTSTFHACGPLSWTDGEGYLQVTVRYTVPLRSIHTQYTSTVDTSHSQVYCIRYSVYCTVQSSPSSISVCYCRGSQFPTPLTGFREGWERDRYSMPHVRPWELPGGMNDWGRRAPWQRLRHVVEPEWGRCRAYCAQSYGYTRLDRRVHQVGKDVLGWEFGSKFVRRKFTWILLQLAWTKNLTETQ